MNMKPFLVAAMTLVSLSSLCAAVELQRGPAIEEAEQCAAGNCGLRSSSVLSGAPVAAEDGGLRSSSVLTKPISGRPALTVASPSMEKAEGKEEGLLSKSWSFVKKNAWPLGGAAVGAIAGGLLGGPVGALVGAAVGGLLGWLAPKAIGFVKGLFSSDKK